MKKFAFKSQIFHFEIKEFLLKLKSKKQSIFSRKKVLKKLLKIAGFQHAGAEQCIVSEHQNHTIGQ